MDKTEQNILKEKMNRIEELKELGYGNMIIEKNSLQEKAILEAEIRGYQLAQKETAEKVEKLIEETKDELVNEIKTHIEQFGKGKNRNIDVREKFTLQMIPIVFEKRLKDKIFNEKNSPNKSEMALRVPVSQQVQTGLDTSSEDNECDCKMFIGGSGKLCPECNKEKI